MHLRMPSMDHGTVSGIWGVFFGVFLWVGLLLIGISGATAFIMGALAGAAVFLFVRHFGGDEPGPARR